MVTQAGRHVVGVLQVSSPPLLETGGTGSGHTMCAGGGGTAWWEGKGEHRAMCIPSGSGGVGAMGTNGKEEDTLTGGHLGRSGRQAIGWGGAGKGEDRHSHRVGVPKRRAARTAWEGKARQAAGKYKNCGEAWQAGKVARGHKQQNVNAQAGVCGRHSPRLGGGINVLGGRPGKL